MRGLSVENPLNAYGIPTVFDQLKPSPNPKLVILIVFLLLPHWCKRWWRADTCSWLDVTHLYAFSLSQVERWGRGGRGYTIPNLSELVTDKPLCPGCYGDGGAGTWGRNGRWGERQTGSKSMFVLTVSSYSHLPWLSISKGYIRVNIRGRGSHWSWWLITGWGRPQ